VVPFAVETKLSGIGDTAFHPVVWYRRTFSIPTATTGGVRGKRVLLHFRRGGLSGACVGERADGGRARGRQHTVHRGRHYAAEAGGKYGGRCAPKIRRRTGRFLAASNTGSSTRGRFLYAHDGIWQPVWIEAVPKDYIERVRITASADGVVRFERK